MSEPSRRNFLKSAAALSAAIPASTLAADPKTDHGAHTAPATAGAAAAQSRPYMFLSQAEVAFLDAAVSHLIPDDELGPGAKEAGVTYFIDQQLLGGYGSMAKKYTQGPWPEGTPEQGYQSPLTPAAVYRAGIRDTNEHCNKTYGGKTFDALTRTQQDEVLKRLDAGTIELEQVRAQFFFNMLLNNTIEGFFADPVYGGNHDKVGWKLVRFPGVAAVYTPFIEQHNVPYEAQPVSIADITGQVAQVDVHGHPIHVMVDEAKAGA
jgi:gluconate 2-dehydrogenase gamma chain